MTRIGTFGANQLYISRILAVQERIQNSQLQVATEKKAQNYSGIAADANRLINFENEKAQASQFIKNNEMAETKLRAASTSVDAARTVIRNFQSILNDLAQHGLTEENRVVEAQKMALNSMLELASYMNVSVDGQYMFAGGRVSTQPVALPAGTLSDFQAMFDGTQTTYPTTRDAHLRKIEVTAAQLGTTTFDATYGLIKPSNFDAFDSVPVGSVFDVSGTTNNNATMTHQGMVTLNAAGVPLTDTATDAGPAFMTTTNGTVLTDATNALTFALQPDGSIRMTGSPVTLAANEKFTIGNSTGNAYDGTYVVSAVNSDGSVTLKNDSSLHAGETTTTGALQLRKDGVDADIIPDGAAIANTTFGAGFTGAEAATFSVVGNTVTLTYAGATGMAGEFPVGSYVDIQGSGLYNGSFEVTASTPDSISFKVSPTAMRVSDLVVPQSGRTDVTMSWNNGANSIGAAEYGTMGFAIGASGETITGNFVDVGGTPQPPAGTVITLSSTSGVNDGQYTVKSNDGTTIVIESKTLTAESTTSAAVTQESWYRGDTMTIQHRVDVARTLEFGIYASDPAIEKALRAMGIIAQGAWGTAGGLENNTDRLDAARFLITDALDGPATGTPPYGAETAGDLEKLQSQMAVVRQSILNTNTKHNEFISFLDTRIIAMENVDMTEAITRLLDDQRALEAGYQALATVRELSLMQYLN